MTLKDKVVVITGAGSGMGRAYAKVYANAGARLALNDFDAAGLAETVRLHGRADIVINNAGISGGFKPVWQLAPVEIERTLRVNLWGVIHGTQAFLPHMLKAQSGQIVNVSSIFGLVGAPNHGDYSASKFAVRGFTEALMTELQETGVTAHLVHPGGIATNIGKVDGEELAFSKHYLTTSPDDIALHVRDKLLKGSAKIVYGKDPLPYDQVRRS